MSFTIFQKEKSPFQLIKTKRFKSRKIDIFQRGKLMVVVQKWQFFQIFFWAIQARKMSFTIFQNETTPSQAIKTRSSNSQKIDIFPNGLIHGFGPKMAIFATFFFLAIQARKMSFTIFQKEKTPFQGIKTSSLKDRKIHIFPKGLVNPCFWSKNGYFLKLFFFRQYIPGKCFLRYSRTKKHLYRL